MTKEEIKTKVEAINVAPSCCPELKAVCGEWLKAYGTAGEKAASEKLIAELEADVSPIEAVRDFFESEAGKAKVGADVAAQLAAHAKEVISAGGKYCDCPACAPGKIVLDNRAVLLG